MGYLSKRAARLTPYTAGEQPKDAKYIKLNTNENPYPPSPKIFPKIEEAAKKLPLYPETNADVLRKAIAQVEHVDENCIFCGNGSDEVLSLTFFAFFDDDRPLLFPDITYSFYPVFAQYYGIPTEILPLDENFRIRLEDYRRPAGGVIFPNPNAPTGIYIEPENLRELLEIHRDCVVAIDEAYIAFGGKTIVPLIGQYDNLLIIRTCSKAHALAGMRVGYAIGQPALIDALRAVKDSFNSYPVDRIAAAAAAAAIADMEYYREIDGKIIVTRDKFAAALTKAGFTVLPSKSNFVFASHPNVPGKEMFAKLRENHILVRHFDNPRIDNFLRISMGTEEQMETVAATMRRIAENYARSR